MLGAAPERLGPYLVTGALGQGSFGDVYAAAFADTGERVALKVLRTMRPDDLAAFKGELRSVSELADPRLVIPFDLRSIEGRWILAMPVAVGVPFAEGLRARLDRGDLGAVRAALADLADTLAALHSQGFVHGDVKPPNVLLDAAGNISLLDFGFVRHLESRPAAGFGLPGSPAWMSPEMLSGQRLSPEGDLWAVGAMSFEALTGRALVDAVEGGIAAIFAGLPVPRVRDLSPGAPPDLADLCDRLLSIDPEGRPTATEVVERLAPGAEARSWLPAPFVGRASILGRVAEAWDCTRERPVVVLVRGEAGVGKSTLLRRVARTLTDAKATLQGRACEHEEVAFAGLDALLDDLRERVLERPDLRDHLHRDPASASLGRLFPVFSDLVTDTEPPDDADETRRQAIGCVRRLLARLADGGRVLVLLDDAQWASRDATLLLAEVLQGPHAPPVCVVAATRPDTDGALPATLGWLRGALDSDFVEVELGPLSRDEAVHLASACGVPEAVTGRLVDETGGSPFLIEAVALATGGLGASAIDWFGQRMGRLDESERTVVEVVALAGRPISAALLRAAAGLTGCDRALVTRLQRLRLLRTTPGFGLRTIDIYHDRLRRMTEEVLSPERRRALHGAIAAALERIEPEPAAVSRHLAEAGDHRAAARWAETAGDRMAASLSFDQAALHYGNALAWGGPVDGRRDALVSKQGRALIDAGRTAEGGEALARLLDSAPAAEASALRLAAGEALLTAGQVEKGLSLLEPLLRAHGLAVPSEGGRGNVSLGVRLTRVLARYGLGRGARKDGPFEPSALQEVDLCWAIGKGTAFLTPVPGWEMMLQGAERALVAGEPVRVGRAMAFVGAGVLSQVPWIAGLGRRFLADARAIGERESSEVLLASCDLWEAMTGMDTARWRRMRDLARRASERFERLPGVAWERVLARGFEARALLHLGRLRECLEVATAGAQDAIRRGDRYGQAMFWHIAGFARLGAGEIAEARHIADWSRREWPERTYPLLAIQPVMIDCYASLFGGDAARAAEVFVAAGQGFSGGGVQRIAHWRIEHALLESRIGLAVGPRPGLRAPEHVAAALERERRPDGPANAAMIRAELALREGRTTEGRACLVRARAGFAAAETELKERVIALRLALLDGDRAAASHHEAWLRETGLANPHATGRLSFPRSTPWRP